MVAVSASRQYVMEEYNLESDPCDYRLIRINNCIQFLACFCSILALFDENLRELSQIVNTIADLVYHTVSGCMTAQVAYEIDYQSTGGQSAVAAATVVNNPMGKPSAPSVVKY